MASSVTAPLERQFGQVPGLKQMTSTSSDGCSVITLQFDLESEHRRGRAAGAGGDQRRVHAILPRDLPNPPIYTQDQSGRRADPHAGAHFGDLPLSKVEDLADTRLAQKISQLPASGWSASAAARSRRCAFRPIPRPGLLWPEPGGRAQRPRRRPTSTRRKAASTAPRQAYTIGANDQLLSSERLSPARSSPTATVRPVKLPDVAASSTAWRTSARRRG